MNEQTAQELLMDYLYGEISPKDEEKLEAYLADHPELRDELDQLAQTRSLLQRMPDVAPRKKLALLEPPASEAGGWRNLPSLFPQSRWGKGAFAAAACLILLLVAGSVANLQIRSDEAGFTIRMGYANQPAQEPQLSEAQTEAIINRIKQENAAILTEYADMLNKHNRQQLQQVVEYFQRQRRNDLQLIDQVLNQYQQETDYQLRQTNQVLGEVLKTVASSEQPQP